MANVFDSTNWPEYPPDPFIAGDYFAFKKTGMTGEFPSAGRCRELFNHRPTAFEDAPE